VIEERAHHLNPPALARTVRSLLELAHHLEQVGDDELATKLIHAAGTATLALERVSRDALSATWSRGAADPLLVHDTR